jgi:hypothetical protein
MCALSDRPGLRDQAMARLLAEAARREATSGHDCPNAEVIAAYADQGFAEGSGKEPLGNGERARLELHFSRCEHCQKILAALGATLETPAEESAAVMPAPAAVPVAQRPAAEHASRRWLWWLSPAFGVAAAALLWMALRPPAPVPVQTAANYSAAAEQETRALNLPARPQATAEAPPAAVARRDAQSLDRLSKTASAEIATEAKTPEQAGAQRAAAQADAVPAAPPPTSPARPRVATAAAPQTPQALVAQSTVAPPAAAEQSTFAAPMSARNQAAAPSRQEAQARAGAVSGALVPQQALQQVPQQSQTEFEPGAEAEQPAVILYTFSSPTGGATWRLGSGGLIERSDDQGRTWQRQASGVTSDLIAGSAAPDNVAWVVGRGGVILRTVDGRHWERVTPPAGVTGGWAAVVAYDSMTATVVSNDFRRYSTRDGGKTWTLQQ